MATIKPFKAIRPSRDKAALATARSYDEYSPKELKSVLNYNPYSFLHIIKPGYSTNEELSGEDRFKLVHKSYLNFKKEDIYKKDEKSQFYLHEKSFENDTFWGIIAVAHVDDYKNNIIKKHEDTLKSREELFGNYLGITGFNAEPVLLTYPDNNYINRIHRKYSQKRSEYEFTTHTKRLHKLWVIDDELDIRNIEKEFSKINAIYIADGHHRTASSAFLANKRKENNPNHTNNECYNYFMSYLISDANLKISAFDRLITDLNGYSKKEFLEKLNEFYIIENRKPKKYQPSKKHHFSMYIDGDYYSLYLRKTDYPINNALSDLDTHIIHKTILKPILGITDLKTDPRIKCLPATFSKKQLKKAVDSGKYAVGFGLYPVSVNQLKAVVNEDLRMPPKSTYIEPKLRSGLTIFEIDE
ncbi:Uncharacterized conserved protein, DUF1015 family [Lutibacter oricola]|uniref:Uncharacterized conserved protein, DUF1015 family n=1 Tax=Lutibacter oricola TaxID=762486 RepID=A0A1H2X4N9_9FLAO|nr:DUF1015 domain-containing protein [Lutibacter oricola]SDW87747.1 Uncharacterized conserved protein, DUF1015 family [Lutibacter oricola]